MDRLEAVADVRQRARHDDAHRVVEVRDPHLVLDADRADLARVVGHVGYSWSRCSGGSGIRRPRPMAGEARRGSDASEVDGAPAGVRIPARRRADRVGRRRGRAWKAVADDPRPMAVVVLGGARSASSLEGGGRRWRGRRWPASGTPTTSAFWTSGSASPISVPRSGRAVRGDVRRAAAAAIDVGHRRDRRADEPALPARGRERPAARARPSGRARRGCPCRYGWASASTVIQSSASRAARRSSCHVRSGFGGQRALQGSNANQRASRSGSRRRRSQTSSSSAATRRFASPLEAARRARPGAACGRRASARCPARRALPGAVLGIGELGGAPRRAAANSAGLEVGRRAPRPSASARVCRSATTARRGRSRPTGRVRGGSLRRRPWPLAGGPPCRRARRRHIGVAAPAPAKP